MVDNKTPGILGTFRKVFNLSAVGDAFSRNNIRLSVPTQFTDQYPFDVMQQPPDPDWMRDNGGYKSPDPVGDPSTDQGRPEKIIVHTDRIGSSGTISFTGYPAEEYFATLKGKHKANIYDQMRRSDPQLKMCLNAVKNPIRSASWEINPVDPDDAVEIEIAEFVNHVLFDAMDKPFDKFISEALTCVDFGHSVFEITNKVINDDPVWGSYVGIKDLGWRSPKTIERWNLDKQTDRLESILQLAWGDTSRFVTIPGNFLLVFSIDREGSLYEGISMLRPCYGAWFRKDMYLKLNAIGIEKFAIPTPVATFPDGKQNSDHYHRLVSMLENYVSHEQQYLLKPEKWEIDLKTNTYDPQKVEVSIDNEDKRMVKAFLANFLELGISTSGGSRALSEDLSAFFLGGIEFIAKEIASEINLTLIPLIVRQNYGERSKYPEIKCSGISDKAGQELSIVLKNLADAQYITPDDPLEEHLRKRIGLPAMSDIGQRKVVAKGSAGVDGNVHAPQEGSNDPAGKKSTDAADSLDLLPNKNLAERIRAAENKRRAILKGKKIK